LGGLVFILLFGMAVPVHAETIRPAGGSPMIPVLGLISSWFRRNRTYRNAEEFITERRQEYVALLKTLDQQRANGTIYTGDNTGPGTQQAAYVRIKALLEQERDQAFAFAESIKNGARKDFNQAAKQQILNIVLSTGFAQNILGALSNGFGHAQQIVEGAISELSGTGSGNIAGQIRGLGNIASQLQLIGGLIGGQTGADLYGTVQGVLDRVNSQLAIATNDLNNIKTDLAALQTKVQGLMAQGYIPSSSEVTNALAMQLVGLGPGTPATEAILTILGVRKGTSKDAIRERATLLLAAGQNARCRRIITELLANLRKLEGGQVDEESNNAPEKTCTGIRTEDLDPGGEGIQPTTTTARPQPGNSAGAGGAGTGNGSGNWHGVACAEAEGTYIYRWSVDLMNDPGTGGLKGTIKFHDCPGGGRVLYSVIGPLPTSSIYTLTGVKREGGGDLFEAAPEELPFTFDSSALTIDQNLAP
jgi:hypothetical protein